MKRTSLKRKTTLRAKQPLRGHTMASKARKLRKTGKVPSKGYKVPKWYKAIPVGSHGNNIVQKRFWKVISDTYRKEDWEKYGTCASCGKHIEHWKDGDCGHFKKYSVCNSWFKYERKNLALQCKKCNQREDGIVGHAFGETLKARWGADIIDWIESENEKYRGSKIEAWEYVERAAELRPDLVVDN